MPKTFKQKFNKMMELPLDTSHSVKELSVLSGIPLRILKELSYIAT